MVPGAFIRVYSRPFAVDIRFRSWCQFDTGTNSGYYEAALNGRNDFQWVFLKVWLSRLISGC
jgi:hypothetical protein